MMTNTVFSQYRNQSLKELIIQLKKDYYDTIIVNCDHIHHIATELHQEAQNPGDSSYIDKCASLATDIRNDIHMSEVIISPYVEELYEKITSNHNCASCTGKCHLNHSMQMQGIKAAHNRVKELQLRISSISNESLPENAGPTRILRNEITCLDTILTELSYLEEAILIPRLLDAQTQINAVR